MNGLSLSFRILGMKCRIRSQIQTFDFLLRSKLREIHDQQILASHEPAHPQRWLVCFLSAHMSAGNWHMSCMQCAILACFRLRLWNIMGLLLSNSFFMTGTIRYVYKVNKETTRANASQKTRMQKINGRLMCQGNPYATARM